MFIIRPLALGCGFPSGRNYCSLGIRGFGNWLTTFRRMDIMVLQWVVVAEEGFDVLAYASVYGDANLVSPSL